MKRVCLASPASRASDAVGKAEVAAGGNCPSVAPTSLASAHANAAAFRTANTQNAFAMTAGGGVDYKLFDHFSIRAFQAEYLRTRFGEGTLGTRTQNNLRVSTGFLFRF